MNESQQIVSALTTPGARYDIVNLEEPIKSVVLSIYEGEWGFDEMHGKFTATHFATAVQIKFLYHSDYFELLGASGLSQPESDRLEKALIYMLQKQQRADLMLKFNRVKATNEKTS